MPVWFSPEPAELIMEIGMKSPGFVPGEPLRRGLVFRAGVGFPLHRARSM
jgi:hypothetical protein